MTIFWFWYGMFFFTEPLKMTYNEDGDRMLKIAIIHGPNPMDGKDMDGTRATYCYVSRFFKKAL